MNSPILPSAIVPNSSADTTCMMLRAKRCSLIAIAAPSISFDDEITKVSSCTTSPPAFGAAPPPVSVTSRTTRSPAATATCSVCVPRPVKKIESFAVPTGTFGIR